MFENVLTKQGKLKILIDTERFDELLSEHSEAAEKLLEYSNAKMFDLLRSPFDTRYDILRRVAEFKAHYDENGNLASIITSREKSETTVYSLYRTKDIESTAAKVYEKESLTEDEIGSVLLVFIQTELHQSDESDLMVTTNDIIIKNRFWFESHFSCLPVNIATLDEALEFMDLFAKFRGTYYVGSNSLYNKGGWYLLSFKTKVPTFQLPWSSVVLGLPLKNGLEMLQGFSNRFTDLLRAVDEIGFQYYLGVGNDTLDAMVYHLNYFITLVTGIFDSLAKLSVIRYDLKINNVDFEKQTGLTKVTLRKPIKRKFPFLEQLTTKNQELSEFIASEQNFVELIYQLRDKILHRERLPQSTFQNHSNEGRWKANFVEIPVEVAASISQFDRKHEHEFVTEWGVYGLATKTFIEPFHFVKASARKLTDFCNNYFELLQFGQLLEMYPEVKRKAEENKTSKTQVPFPKQLEIFEKCHLGF